MDGGAKAWIDEELASCHFADERLGKRLRTLLDQMAGTMGESIPLACQDWAHTKAADRFFSNDRVSEAEILGGHFDATRSRFAGAAGPILVLQDTTEFSFQRERPDLIGQTCRVNSGQDKDGRFRMHIPDAHRLRAAEARQSGGDDRWTAAGAGGGEVLVAKDIQGNRCPQE